MQPIYVLRDHKVGHAVPRQLGQGQVRLGGPKERKKGGLAKNFSPHRILCFSLCVIPGDADRGLLAPLLQGPDTARTAKVLEETLYTVTYYLVHSEKNTPKKGRCPFRTSHRYPCRGANPSPGVEDGAAGAGKGLATARILPLPGEGQVVNVLGQ